MLPIGSFYATDTEEARAGPTVSLVRSSSSVDRNDPAPARVRAPEPRGPVAVDDMVAAAREREEDDQFQWFVNLFVAEYASDPDRF